MQMVKGNPVVLKEALTVSMELISGWLEGLLSFSFLLIFGYLPFVALLAILTADIVNKRT